MVTTAESPVDTRGGPDRGLLIVTSVTLVSRALAAWLHPVIFNDGPRFVAIAREALQGDWIAVVSHQFHPLTSLLMAAVHAATAMELDAAGRAVSVVASCVGAAAIWALARRQFGSTVAICAGLLFAAHPRLLAVGAGTQSDALYVALFGSSAYLVWRVLDDAPTLRIALGAGVTAGLAYLARPEGGMPMVVLAVWVAAALLVRRIAFRRAVVIGLAAAIGLAATAGPYLVGMRVAHGGWELTYKKGVTHAVVTTGEQLTARTSEDGAEQDNRAAAAAREVGVDAFRAFGPLMLALGLIGLFSARPDRRAGYWATYALLFSIVLLSLHLSSGYVSRRHWLGPVALWLPFAGAGLVAAVRRLRPGREARLAPVFAGVLAVAFVGYQLTTGEPPHKAARRDAALWIQTSHPGRVVAAHRVREGYYAAAARFVVLPDESEPSTHDPEALVRTLVEQGVEFVVIDEKRFPSAAEEAGVMRLHRVPYRGGAVVVLSLPGVTPRVGSAPR